MLLIQRWYNLSDPGLEEAVKDRISFLRFTGFSLEDSVPDETTICRNELVKTGVFDDLLRGINDQLTVKGLIIQTGAVVDASLISSTRRPRKVIDVPVEDRKETEATVSPCEITDSDDREAAWLKKGVYYGYNTDSQSKI